MEHLAEMPGLSLAPIVLVEAEATLGGAYDGWEDVTGERYHFPNQYKNRVLPGRRFVYYRGVRRAGGRRGVAEYFGFGRIGTVWRDESSVLQPRKARWAWYCSIDDYVEFTSPVASRLGVGYYEAITHSRGWQVGVRPISDSAYSEIILAAGFIPTSSALPVGRHSAVTLIESSSLLRVRLPRTITPTVTIAHTFRRSRRSKEIGDLAESLIVSYLRSRFSNVRWHSSEGELPGYDLSYENGGEHNVVEVKGTAGDSFPAIELTTNEWRAAQEIGERFWLYLVASCETSTPRFQAIRNPAALLANGTARLIPLIFRFELHGDAGGFFD